MALGTTDWEELAAAAADAAAAYAAMPEYAARAAEVRGLYPQQLHDEPSAHLARRLEYARRSVPFYRSRVHSKGDLALADFPITRRTDVVVEFPNFIARDEDDVMPVTLPTYILATSGSTGKRVSILKTRNDAHVGAAVMDFLFSQFVGAKDPIRTIDCGPLPPDSPAVEAVPLVRTLISHKVLDRDREDAELRAAWVLAQGPFDLILGLPSRIAWLAEFAINRGLHVPCGGAVTSYETLTNGQRELILQAFGCATISSYGAGEIGDAAWECSARRFHFPPDLAVAEIVRSDGREAAAGETGELLLTPVLDGALMPLVRYATGDRAMVAVGPCPCGLSTPSAAAIRGRSAARLLDSNGNSIDGFEVTEALDEAGAVDFQVVQKRPGDLIIWLSRMDPVSADVCVAAVRTRLGGNRFGITVERTDNFHLAESGKRNAVWQQLRLEGALDDVSADKS
jgi:phenylacetate-CoA ligase